MPASRPSIPDRKRFDSDVRALMRQPSTPWITFDRDSRLPQGEAPEALVAPAAMFPETTLQPVSEPSSLVVASEIEEPPALPMQQVGVGRHRVIAFAAAAVAMLAGAAALLSVRIDAKHVRAEDRAAAAPVVTDVPPPDLALAPPPEPEPAKPAAPKIAPDDPRAKLGRLSIRGLASGQWVFFDGKRLLGKGARSFDVMCGAHTIGIGKREGAQSVDVPCMGELVVER